MTLSRITDLRNHKKNPTILNLVFGSAEDLIQELLVGELLHSSNHSIIKPNKANTYSILRK